MQKWPSMDQNHLLTPLEKWQFFDFLTSCFYSLERRFFVVENRKRQFPGLFCPSPPKKVKKMANFGPKPWVNLFRKMAILRLFELLVFIA